MLGVTLRDTARDIVSRHGPAKGGSVTSARWGIYINIYTPLMSRPSPARRVSEISGKAALAASNRG